MFAPAVDAWMSGPRPRQRRGVPGARPSTTGRPPSRDSQGALGARRRLRARNSGRRTGPPRPPRSRRRPRRNPSRCSRERRNRRAGRGAPAVELFVVGHLLALAAMRAGMISYWATGDRGVRSTPLQQQDRDRSGSGATSPKRAARTWPGPGRFTAPPPPQVRRTGTRRGRAAQAAAAGPDPGLPGVSVGR